MCNIVLKYDVRNCTEPLSSFVEDKVQPITANINMAKQMIEAFVPALLSLFIGPWSDENGRRTFLLMSLGGKILMYCNFVLLRIMHALSVCHINTCRHNIVTFVYYMSHKLCVCVND